MLNFLYLFSALIMAHFLFDYPLQGDFVAKFKARFVDGRHNNVWRWVLTAHAATHALPVLLITKSLSLSLFMFLTHFFIDFLKCENKITFNQDQIYHLVVILIISLVAHANGVLLL